MTTRRASTSTRESSDHGTGPPAVTLSHPHRRMSRMIDPNFTYHAARRMSMYRRPSLAGSQKTDLSHSVVIPVKLQNTYKMEPEDDEKFNSARVSKVLSGILKSFLEGEQYEAKKCTALSQSLTDVVKSRVKEMNFQRYKFVCHILIGENANQDIHAASRCVWDTSTDNFAQGTFSNMSLFAVASVYGCYYE